MRIRDVVLCLTNGEPRNGHFAKTAVSRPLVSFTDFKPQLERLPL
jgi:hypothetical protein